MVSFLYRYADTYLLSQWWSNGEGHSCHTSHRQITGANISVPPPPIPFKAGPCVGPRWAPCVILRCQVSGSRRTDQGPSGRIRVPPTKQDKLEPRMTIQSSAKRIKTRSINRATRTNQDLAHLYTILLNININLYHYKNANS